MRKKVGLALGAGGARGIAHIGVLEVLEENNIPIDFIAGSSMGGLVGGCYAAGISLNEIKDAIEPLRMLQILDLSFLANRGLGFIKGEKVVKILTQLIQNEQIEFKDTKIPFSCTAVDLLTGKPVVLNSGSLIKAMRATMSIPILFQPVKIDDMLLIDGGLLNRVPVQTVRDMGADVVLAFDVLGEANTMNELKGFTQMIIRTFDILDWEISKSKTNTADLYVLFEQDDVDVLSTKHIGMAYARGRETAEANLDKIKEIVFGE